jgi:tRNA pseudouridine38-40 synthase
MNRYFLEVAYDGFNFSGFQIQNNAITIQSSIEDAFLILLKKKIKLTGSSRTDAQVNAYQNFFHFDFEEIINEKIIYNLNAIIPSEIVIKSIQQVSFDAHARFSAISRTYEYFITEFKNPFLQNKAYYFPYKLSLEKLNEAATYLATQHNFINFSKTNTEVNNFNCTIVKSNWRRENNVIIYTVEANRFLRGMVKALVGTTLLYAKEKITLVEFQSLFNENATIRANFSPPGYALFLKHVKYPNNIF